MASKFMYLKNIRPESKVRGNLPLINPEPKGPGVYQWQASVDRGQELHSLSNTP